MALDEIYKEVILDHYKNPRNKREVPDAPLSWHRKNPLCGDEITVTATVDGETLSDVAFTGKGCSISQASASMMTEAISGEAVQDALAMAAEFRSMMAGDADPSEDEFGEQASAGSGRSSVAPRSGRLARPSSPRRGQ